MVDQTRIMNTLSKMALHLSTHDSIVVSVSGGSDSDIIVHMIGTYFREYIPKIHFVFINTGLEYQATKRHIVEIQEKYNIVIDEIRGESVVSTVRKNGVPIVSKEFSKIVNGVQRNAGESYLKKLYATREESSGYALSKNQKALADYLIQNDIKVSEKCCTVSKKNPSHKYEKEKSADLVITGERRCEGGYVPLNIKIVLKAPKQEINICRYFFWDDETKQWYKEYEGIRYSDCYEVWGMKRTGCVGCPFNSRVGKDLKMIEKYEPNLYKACINVFGESYRLMDRFNIHKARIFEDEDGDMSDM